MSESVRVVEVLSAGEVRFEQWRRRAGCVIAPLVFLLLLALPPEALKPEAQRLAAVMAAVMVLWITEALPMAVTALTGAAACVVLRVAPAREVFVAFADPLIFLYIGSFILAQAIFYHRLDRRVAFGVLSIGWIEARPARILFAFGAVTAFISAWISNTATAAMMFPIGLSIINFLFANEAAGGSRFNRRYATALMLIIAFGASVGGYATPIGTPTNVIGLGFIRQLLGIEISFFEWSLIGVPVALCLFAFLYLYLNRLCPAGVAEIEGSREMIARERESLGRWTRGQKSTLVAFGATVLLWIIPGIIALAFGDGSPVYQSLNRSLPEAIPAVLGAALLFVLPGDRGERALAWGEAVKIDWGVVLLFGGGLTFGLLSFQTGLAEWIGRGLTGALSLEGSLGLLTASVIVAAVMSETTSNVASANMVIPVVISMAGAAGVDPLAPTLGAALGSSLGFMLPVSTPPNAIVYGSGYVPLMRMVRYGLLLDVVGIVVIITLVHLLTPLVR